MQALATLTTKPLVVVLIHGGPIDVSDMVASPRVGAILSTSYPGQHGAIAVADILLGKTSPSGGVALEAAGADSFSGCESILFGQRSAE